MKLVDIMREIKDIFLERDISFRVKNPYPTALDVMEIASHFGKVIERENKLMTDGPRKFIRLVFDLEDNIDDRSKVQVFFDIYGEANEIGWLNMKIYAQIVSHMRTPENIATETFEDFYATEIYPDIERTAKEKIRRAIETIEAKIFS
jgi:hypothetical protein